MSLSLGQKLRLRAMVYVAGEAIPNFWPMRSFIHHNPLHGLEHLTFTEAVRKAQPLFHAQVYLSRKQHQAYLSRNLVDMDFLEHAVADFVAQQPLLPDIDLQAWLMSLLKSEEHNVVADTTLSNAADVQAVLAGKPLDPKTPEALKTIIVEQLRNDLLNNCPLYEAIDALYGTEIGDELDQLVIKSSLDFFDEGQSVWSMPGREKGFFPAWCAVAQRNGRLFLRGLDIDQVIQQGDTPEDVIAYVMDKFGVPEQHWVCYFTCELARLHGWTGFIKWRSGASHYHWRKQFPGDLVDLLAIRLILALALVEERGRWKKVSANFASIQALIDASPEETYFQLQLHGRKVLPEFAFSVEKLLATGRTKAINKAFGEYAQQVRLHEARQQAANLVQLAGNVSALSALRALPDEALGQLIQSLQAFEQEEGHIWLRAMESQAMKRLLAGVTLEQPAPREKRPFVQALFCIDTRSERIRRRLESIGDYQTFGIAGFFGVPLSFMELGKGNESHLCPVLLTPKNLVVEMAVSDDQDVAALTVLEKALHELKESILTPFVTVEAVGLLFGFDMVGKTLFPEHYNRWRNRLHQDKPQTFLIMDKLSSEQADSIVRAVQRAVIEKALELEFELPAERITDSMVRELREAALGHQPDIPVLAKEIGLSATGQQDFIQKLRTIYRINAAKAQLQREQLGRIGFSIDEQVTFVSQALQSIGLTREFSRFIMLVGHGSTSENNPYESALDCGACGGQHGIVNARVLAQMANKPEVRRRLRQQGIDIPDDAWFFPALHNTTTDEIRLYDVERMPSTHAMYIDRLRNGLLSAARLCARERIATLEPRHIINRPHENPAAAQRLARKFAQDWSQVRPEWGLAGNAYFIIGRRPLTQQLSLEGRAFLHSYDYRVDRKLRLLENILTGPLVVGQWINMEHYFSTVDNERFGSGSKVYHNVAGRFGVMTGNLSDLRTGLPAQTVLDNGQPYHQPLRLITVIEAPLQSARRAVESVAAAKKLVVNEWIRLIVIDPEQSSVSLYDKGQWQDHVYSLQYESQEATANL